MSISGAKNDETDTALDDFKSLLELTTEKDIDAMIMQSFISINILKLP
jgi:hypothetical protein